MKQHRGLYGQAEGNEHRPSGAALADICADNEIVEGEYVETLRSMIKRGAWAAIALYTENLRKMGWNQSRINSVLSRAGYKMRI